MCAWKSEENACYRVEIKKLTEKGEIKVCKGCVRGRESNFSHWLLVFSD